MKNKIQVVQENINRLTKLIESHSKNESHDPETVRKLRTEYAEQIQELSRLRKEQWEETHERLDYGDDR